MNYYQHHIGDYAAATAYLSLVEDAIYTRLLRVYYRDEKPLPTDTKAVAWLIGLRSKKEVALLDNLLPQFFMLQADGWHNQRADEEISAYREKQNKAKAAIDARWSKAKDTSPEGTDGECRNNEQDTDVLPATYERNTDVIATNNHKPITNNQQPLTNNQKTEPTTGTSPVVGSAQARATPATAPPVDNFLEPQGLATAQPAEPKPPPAEPKPPPAEPPSVAKTSAHGTRLPESWQLPRDWGEWALAERDDLTDDDVRHEAAQFADYWHAKAGKDARKADWQATWRNWIRKAHPKNRNGFALARASPPIHAQTANGDDWIRPASLHAREAARQKLFGVVIDATG